MRPKKVLSTEELLEVLDALIEANTSSDVDVKNHFTMISSKYKTLDKIPYEDAMKLIVLTRNAKLERMTQTPKTPP